MPEQKKFRMTSTIVDSHVSQQSTYELYTYNRPNIVCKPYESTSIQSSNSTHQYVMEYLQGTNLSPMLITLPVDQKIDAEHVQYEKMKHYSATVHTIISNETIQDIDSFVTMCVHLGHMKQHESLIFDISNINKQDKTKWTDKIYLIINRIHYGVFRKVYILN